MAKKKVNAFLKFRFNLTHRINLYNRLRSYVEEEFPVYDSLLKFKKRYEKKNDFRAKIISDWLDKMHQGASFSRAIEGWIPDSELNLIASGEDGKGVETGLAEAVKFATSAQRISSTIKTGATYPVVLIFVILTFIAMFSIQMAPTYLNNLPLERWPDLGQYLYGFSTFLVNQWIVLLTVSVATIILVMKTMSVWTGKAREIADKMPPWSIYKVYHASSFLISLASMMQSGTPLHDSLIKIKKTSPKWLKAYIDEMIRNLRKGGKNFGQHLDVGLFDEETAGDVIDYSDLGKFEQAVYSIGEANLQSSVLKIESRMALVRNLMIVLVGITVGVIYYTSIELNSAVAEAASANTTRVMKK